MRIKTTLKAHGGPHCRQDAKDRAITDGWNAQGAGDPLGANPWLTEEPEHYFWREGWRARNQMCAQYRPKEVILCLPRGRAWATRRSTIGATALSAGSHATERPMGRGFAAGTAAE